MVGGFLGDFVKGRLGGLYPSEIERGIALHRAVDAFADNHPATRQSVRRFAKPFRRYGPIMVDVIYDHFLAEYWATYHGESIEAFCDSVFSALNAHSDLLPAGARATAERMMASRSMAKYDRHNFVAGSLENISRRLTRENPLAAGFDEFLQHRSELCEDFTIFFPDLLRFCAHWRQQH